MKFTFSASALKHGVAVAKFIKPASGDFVIRMKSDGMTLFASDKRRFACVNVKAREPVDVDAGWTSEEFFIPATKMSLFDSNLDHVSFTLGDNSAVIQAVDGKQTRRATLKRRIDSMRRTHIPDLRIGSMQHISADSFSKLIRMVGCSALVKETKTDDEMRVNQVHFVPDGECAFSNARFHASVGYLPGMKLDLSIIGSDIPVLRSFCSKIDGSIGLFQDRSKLYAIDPETGSVIAFGRVSSGGKPDFQPPSDEFSAELFANKDKLKSGLEWALTALDGTQRLTCSAENDMMSMSNNGEIFSTPVEFKRGSSIKADIPARFLKSIVDHIDSESVVIKFGHRDNPTIMSVSGNEDSNVKVLHYLQTMRGR